MLAPLRSPQSSLLSSTVGQVPAKISAIVQSPQVWMATSGLLLLALVGLSLWFKMASKNWAKRLKFETFKNKELQKKYKLALKTIHKMETNPDLVHSREFNLDYLKMRMEEEIFHFAILNQIKIRMKDKISAALRPTQAEQGIVGIASTGGHQIDETFDVEYQTSDLPNAKRGVLFRVQVRLTRLPTQTTNATIEELINCIEAYLDPNTDPSWQPSLQGRVVYMHWDQKAKPTPLLVLEQSNEGVNVTFRTNRRMGMPPTPLPKSTRPQPRSPSASTPSRTPPLPQPAAEPGQAPPSSPPAKLPPSGKRPTS
ncbi:hypothetical protein OOK60_06640 [Trichothermofontia sichuanensis B231]|uniref:hypothetical protein n=1 Tax=Trichothermofontia sichuanensis TaxID=3045816 RepID=UPI002247FC1E|nr:hypothetical protein [Trichothermofontia sichuanensis]UZQ55743.1 hypothetical protein OOK60_06640 [Trichothermofontia sichuanensis B231]